MAGDDGQMATPIRSVIREEAIPAIVRRLDFFSACSSCLSNSSTSDSVAIGSPSILGGSPMHSAILLTPRYRASKGFVGRLGYFGGESNS